MTAPYVFLDLDGTLVRSDPGIIASVCHTLETMGLPVPQTDMTWLIGPTLNHSFPRLGVPPQDVDQALEIYRARYDVLGYTEAERFDGLEEALIALKRNGFSLAVATSKPQDAALKSLGHFDLLGHFTHVFGAIAEGHASSKKEVVLARALSETGADPARSVMVGDREHDVKGAKANGLRVIGVRYGYGQAGELEAAGADRIIESAHELPDCVAELLPREVHHAR